MSRKLRVDRLFYFHALVAAVVGTVAFVFPHAFEWFLIHHGEKFALRDNADDGSKIEHLVIRMYGAIILAQAIIVHSARKTDSAPFRRALVQAYTLAFGLTTLALLRAQLTEGGRLNAYNWLNISMFAALTGGYGWFAFFEKINAFEGLTKMTL